MCRSIKTLRRPDAAATEQEIHAAALQFVRKVSGFRQPSQSNQQAFDAAVDEIAAAAERLLGSLSQNTRVSAQRSRRSGSSSTAAK